STLTLKIGDSENLKTIISPKNATDQSVVWASSRPDVATVDGNGKVTAVGNGEATITATSKNNIQGKCTVTVEKLSSNANTEPLQEFQVL
ncbi:MAG: Ig-like domain-containing protein, partial [Bacteroidales bacterium]|nr:Ig-like domain-containing protein [Bacteroidales bacterium]